MLGNAAIELLGQVWRDYVAVAPEAERIRQLLTARGELVHHDHVALTTFDLPGLGIDAAARPFEMLGWQPRERYRFDEQHLRARYWRHDDPDAPKVFIAELAVAELSRDARRVIGGLVAQLPRGFAPDPGVGRPWTPTLADYQVLLRESEPAARLAALGFRADHFTIDAAALVSFPDLEALVAFLAENGFALQRAGGGLVERSPASRLEQAATRAGTLHVAFADGTARIPSCRYRMVRRCPIPAELFLSLRTASSPSRSRSSR